MRSALRVCAVAVFVLVTGCKPDQMGNDGGGGGNGASCEVGSQGCPCSAEMRCAKNARGEQLVCQAGTCSVMTCAAGERGCVCRGGSECNNGDACTGGFCTAPGCAAGTKDCTCLAGSCEAGSTCLENTICVDSAGYEGGACLANGRCNRGNRCDSSTNHCVFCSPGTAGCNCNTNNACNAGLACSADTCLSAAQLPPANPVCYTPCRDNLDLDDGGIVRCTTDQTFAGCLPDQTCNRGSCLPAGASKPSCSSDLDCPFFQTCLAGGCYSNCDVNADCSSGRGCYRHACRATCTVSQSSSQCPNGFACTANDGENGFCLPVGTASQAAMTQVLPTGGLELATERLELSNVNAAGNFMVVSKTNATQDVTVRKLWHQVSYADGRTERVDAPKDAQGNYRDCDPARNECPLFWLKMGVPGTTPGSQLPALQVPKATFRLLPNCANTLKDNDAGSLTPCPSVRLENAGGIQAVRYEGAIEVASRDARVIMNVAYVQRPEGQWMGSMYYFGSFDTTALDEWINKPDSQRGELGNVKNAFIAKWTALRKRNLEGWGEFIAMLTSTRTESWKYGLVADRCAHLGTTVNSLAACYPYTNEVGLKYYVQDKRANPIPSGVSELPFAMNLKIGSSGTSPDAGTLFEGRVESSTAMHYPGNPGIKLEFIANPADISSCAGTGGSVSDGGAADCVVYLKAKSTVANSLSSDIGGRYYSTSAEGCAPGYAAVQVPWLLPALKGGEQPPTGDPFRVECREQQLPFANAPEANKSLASGNPVPDGKVRHRRLEFIDGALVNQSELFVIFRETYESSIPMTGSMGSTSAYGYFRLKRAQANLDATSYTSKPVTTGITRAEPIQRGAVCSQALLSEWSSALPTSNNLGMTPLNSWTARSRTELAELLMKGSAASGGYIPLIPGGGAYTVPQPSTTTDTRTSGVYVHYLCEDLGIFNGGKNDVGTALPDGGSNTAKLACPAGSKVTYFLSTKTPAAVANEPCNELVANGTNSTTITTDGGISMTTGSSRGTCGTTLQTWVSSSLVAEVSPKYECVGSTDSVNDVFCDDNRQDLRRNKRFFFKVAPVTQKTYLPLRALIDAAFRYKTRFRSTTGGTLGFAPAVCVANAQSIPYCYDPAEIEEARARIDCLMAIYTGDSSSTWLDSGATRTALNKFLKQSYSSFENGYEGFERLYAELLINQGDESLTSAYASRFDLAGVGGATFKGSVLESNGIDLTGVAGAEMFRLYQAVQYYQMALDRLYMMGPNMSTALGRGGLSDDRNFLSNATMTDYLERLVRAASQKSRAWGEIARRYQNFNRPDLARAVIERGYVTTYLESALLSRLMQDLDAIGTSNFVDQNRITIEKTQRSYRMALLDMREVYEQITDNQNFFGYPPDYIPFPSIDGASTSSAHAYDVLKQLAQQRLDLARVREQAALAAGKQGRVDAVQFQSDLTSIRNNYENQLAGLCGTFRGSDGRAYPAIRKYAHLNDVAVLMGDPCGRMGNGEIHNAMAATKDNALKLQGVLLRHENTLKEIDIERARVAAQCQLINNLADLQYTRSQHIINLQQDMAEQRALMTFISASVQAVIASIEVADCEIQCASSAAMAAVTTATGIASAGAAYASELILAQKESDLKTYEAESLRLQAVGMCNGQQIDSVARIGGMINNTLEIQLEALRADYGLRVSVADVTKLNSQAQRLQSQQEETEQLTIDLQAAQNDPNVRIYQNDAIINADVSFKDALATAYRLTRVYEYYTSTSYAKKEQLFLIRMIQSGQYNLENYLLELDNAFNTFEEQFGNPDLRVLAISLRDDVMKIPYLSTTGTALSESDRIQMMRERLRDVRLLDGRGYLNLPFSTDIKSLSPLTRNHKIRHVEIDLQGSKVGDSTARVYLRMSGTGVVRNVNDEIDYFIFPERIAVVNTSLLGAKVYDPEVYRNYRFRDRPLVNTTWELVINQRDELANQDIDLQSLTDIRVIIYYSDFTAF